MKLSPILSRYLINEKQLSIPGIGKFSIDGSYEQPTENSRQKTTRHNINFVYNSREIISDGLIDFISAESGKMKSLSRSDFDSQLELMKQFLNIGKPFLLEGIGTLSKEKNGELTFIQDTGTYTEKPKETPIKVKEPTPKEDYYGDYNEILSTKKRTNGPARRVLLILLLVAGLGAAIWGGYRFYKNSQSEPAASNETADTTIPVTEPLQMPNDTSATVSPSDTANITAPTVQPATNTYSYVIREADSISAYRRYNQLAELKTDVKIAQADPGRYQVFFDIANPDTTKIKDSLNLLYVGGGKSKVWIRKN